MENLTVRDLIKSIANGAYLNGLDVADLIRDYGDLPIIVNTENGEEFAKFATTTNQEVVISL